MMPKFSPSQKEIVVISLGGSIINPGKIQVDFLKKFRRLILKFLKRGYRFVIVAGGGKICRDYQKAASEITKISDEDKDWIGIHATRLNAHLIRTIFKKEAYPIVLDNPLKQINGGNYNVFIGSGWRPGWSTDYDAVLLAERFKARKIINASNIDYVYEKDPHTKIWCRGKRAKPIKEITWAKYCKLIGSKWKPGMKVPIDPIAARLASKLKMTIIVTKGTNLKNLEQILKNKNLLAPPVGGARQNLEYSVFKKFKGTIIKP